MAEPTIEPTRRTEAKKKSKFQHEHVEQKKARSITDREGHFDLDGVSYDTGVGVIVTSDGNKKFAKPKAGETT